MKDKMRFEQLESIVMEYQNGSDEAAEALIASYDVFLDKLVNVLCFGMPFNIHDKTQRNFIKLFMRDGASRRNINRYQRSGTTVEHVERTLHYVRSALAPMEADEAKNELVCLFLDMALSHDGSGLFGGYINDYFTLRASSLFIGMINERTKNSTYEVPLYDVHTTEDTYRFRNERVRLYEIYSFTDSEFDENWINGRDASEVFEMLTPYERRLIKWYYEWKTYDSRLMTLPKDVMKERKSRFRHTDEDIAEILGCSRKTVNMKRKEAKEVIERIAKELHLITR